MPRTKPTEDSAEKIKRCLSCKLRECNNCLARGGEKKYKRRNRRINFFGEELTFNEIAKELDTTYREVYNWERYGGANWVEERAKKLGYKPKGE